MFLKISAAFVLCATTSFAQTSKVKVPKPSVGSSTTTTGQSFIFDGPKNNLRLFPLNVLESSVHGSYERRLQDKIAVGIEVSQTVGDSRAMFFPDIEFQETYLGPLGQYFLNPDFEGFFVEGGLNLARVKIAANVGLRGEKVDKEQTYIMPHATANFRMRTTNGFSATVGGGLFAFLGGDELKIDETKRGFVDGAFVEKKTKVETPYNSSPKLRVRLDLGYTF